MFGGIFDHRYDKGGKLRFVDVDGDKIIFESNGRKWTITKGGLDIKIASLKTHGDREKRLSEWENLRSDAEMRLDINRRIRDAQSKESLGQRIARLEKERQSSPQQAQQGKQTEKTTAARKEKQKPNKKAQSRPKGNEDLDMLIKDTIRGKYGNGIDRRRALGDRYEEVQKGVNEWMRKKKSKAEERPVPMAKTKLVDPRSGAESEEAVPSWVGRSDEDNLSDYGTEPESARYVANDGSHPDEMHQDERLSPRAPYDELEDVEPDENEMDRILRLARRYPAQR